MTARQNAVYALLKVHAGSWVSCDTITRTVKGFGENTSTQAHDTTAKKELRQDKKAIERETLDLIISSANGYKLVTDFKEAAEWVQRSIESRKRAIAREYARLKKIHCNGQVITGVCVNEDI